MKILTSLKRPVIVDGAVSYNESARSHNIIRLRKKIIKEFPDLVNSRFINYKVELWRSYDDLEERISELKQKKTGIPILLFLYTKGNYQRAVIKEFKGQMNEEIINSDLEKCKDILRENWSLLSEDMKELLKLIGVEGKE